MLRFPRVLDEPARAEREGGEDRVDVLLLEHEERDRGVDLVPDPQLWVYPSAWSALVCREAFCRVSGDVGVKKS